MRTIELIFEDNSNYFIKESFNTLRTNVLFSGKGVKTIVVTSCFAHEGKSTVSFEMARSLAEAGKKVLFVDADLRKSMMVTRHTKERGIFGLSQYLSGQVEMEQVIYHTQIRDLDVIFSGPYPPNPAELVGNPAFRELLNVKRDQYDYIIIDAPPLGMVIDAAVISGICDGAIMVVNVGNVKYRIAQNVKGQLEKSGCKVLGVVLNQATHKRKRSSYRQQYEEYQSSAQMNLARAQQQQARAQAARNTQQMKQRLPQKPSDQ